MPMRKRLLTYFIFLSFGITTFVVFAPHSALADVIYKLQIPLPPFPNQEIELCKEGASLSCSGIAKYLAFVYKWLIGFAAALGVGALTIAGLIWLTARGESKQVENAHTIIKNTIWGIILALCSFVILNALNPRLVQFDALNLDKIKEMQLIIECHKTGTTTPTPSGVSESAFTNISFNYSFSPNRIKDLAKEYVDYLLEADTQGISVVVYTVHDLRVADFRGSKIEIEKLEDFLKKKGLQVGSAGDSKGIYELHGGYCK